MALTRATHENRMIRICEQLRLDDDALVASNMGITRCETYVVIVAQNNIPKLSILVLHPKLSHRRPKRHKLCGD